MEEMQVKVLNADGEAEWIDTSAYLKDRIADLIPMCVGQCVRFRMGGAEDVRPADLLAAGAIRRVALTNKATPYLDSEHGVVLVLVDAVEVSVTFDGDAVIKASNLLDPVTVDIDYGLPPLETDLDPRVRLLISPIAEGGEVRFEKHLDRLEKTFFEDKTGKFLPFLKNPWNGRDYLRKQMRYYAGMFAALDCAICGGAGVLEKKQPGMKSADVFCRCLLPLSK